MEQQNGREEESNMFGLKLQTPLQKIVSKMLELRARRDALDGAIDLAEHEAAGALMEGADADVALNHVVKLKAEKSALDIAIRSLQPKRSEAILAGFRADAAKLRTASTAKTKELAEIENRLAKLMSQVSQLQSVTMIATVDGNQPNSQYAFPRTTTLATEIATLNQQAADLESKNVPTHGRIDLNGITSDIEVCTAVLQHPSDIPSIDAILAWLKGCEAASRQTFGPAPRRVFLAWADGTIDLETSYVYVAGLANKFVDHVPVSVPARATPEEKQAIRDAAPTVERYDVPSGTFKATA